MSHRLFQQVKNVLQNCFSSGQNKKICVKYGQFIGSTSKLHSHPGGMREISSICACNQAMFPW